MLLLAALELEDAALELADEALLAREAEALLFDTEDDASARFTKASERTEEAVKRVVKRTSFIMRLN